ncbi:MAG: hypothetical protein KF824_05575 [Fimbriimonadaceae bacterium]|nr:MAG: hypothetical protein KF824_05575 [Fimbriimonadaceae bacterium]
MSKVGQISVGNRVNGHQIGAIVLMALVLCVGLAVKLDRAPSIFELILDPVRLMVPISLLAFSQLRRKIGVSRRFALMGVACVALTIASELLKGIGGSVLLVAAFGIYVWLLANCRVKGNVDSGIAGLALCLIMAPIF